MEEINKNIEELKLKIKMYINYFLVFIVSFSIMIVAPMWQNDLTGFHVEFPTTKSGWLSYIALRGVIAVLNMFIFACFVRQGELNASKHPNKLKADEILGKLEIGKAYVPLSPNQFRAKQYGGKGFGVMIGSFVALVALPPILSYDWKMAITYLFTIVNSVAFGIYQTMLTEQYWEEDYLKWAIMMSEKEAKEKEGKKENAQI